MSAASLKDMRDSYEEAKRLLRQYTPASHAHGKGNVLAVIDGVKGFGRPHDPEVQILDLQAQALSIYFDVGKFGLSSKRYKLPEDAQYEINFAVPQALEDLELLKRGLDSSNLTKSDKNKILPDYYNNVGLVREFQAHMASDDDTKREYGRLAIQAFTNALEINPQALNAEQNRARVYYEVMDDETAARRCWDNVEQLHPRDRYRLNNLGNIAFDKGQYGEARKLWEQSADIHGTDQKLAGLSTIESEAPQRGGAANRTLKATDLIA